MKTQKHSLPIKFTAVIIAMLTTCGAWATCWTKSVPSYPQNVTKCNCSFGSSGSCYDSYTAQYSPPILVSECKAALSGAVSCDNGNSVLIGIKYPCGDQGWDTAGLIYCAVQVGLAPVAIYGALRTGASALWTLITTTSATATIAAGWKCEWCKVHVCGAYKGDPGQEIRGYTNPVLSSDKCS